MMNSAVASLLGRPDLVGVPTDTYGGSSGVLQATATGSVGASSLNTSGRLTAGVLMVMVLLVVGFHVWTHDIQV